MISMARTVAWALVSSRLDYANAVLYNTTASNIVKLQHTQNALAHVVSFTRRMEHTRPLLQQLHWLPVSFHIDYKIATLASNVLKTGCLDYLRQSVHFYPPFWHLHSINQLLLFKNQQQEQRYPHMLSAMLLLPSGTVYLTTFA